MRFHTFRLVLGAALGFVVTASGCGSALSYLRLPHDEQRLFEIYSGFMTSSQQAEYLRLTTPTDRAAYAESLGVRRRFLALPEGERETVLAQRLVRGMSAEALVMSWGYPWHRFRLGEDDEEWEYWPYFARHLPPSMGYRIYLRAGRVYEWVQFVVPAPEHSVSRGLKRTECCGRVGS
ncbi:MAG: hypothetical protein ACE5JN_10625 [Candidatus Methylomirabilia bacterium]